MTELHESSGSAVPSVDSCHKRGFDLLSSEKKSMSFGI